MTAANRNRTATSTTLLEKILSMTGLRHESPVRQPSAMRPLCRFALSGQSPNCGRGPGHMAAKRRPLACSGANACLGVKWHQPPKRDQWPVSMAALATVSPAREPPLYGRERSLRVSLPFVSLFWCYTHSLTSGFTRYESESSLVYLVQSLFCH